MRVAAFVSGGLIPEHLRGTSNNMRFHIVDWCECSNGLGFGLPRL